MKRTHWRSLTWGLLGALLLLVVAAPALAQRAAANADTPVTAEQVDQAVERGVANLWSLQLPDGSWPKFSYGDFGEYVGGNDAMSMLALIYAGEPMSKPEMKRGVAHLVDIKMIQTYCIAFRTIGLAELYRHKDVDQSLKTVLRAAMKRDVDLLLAMRCTNGAWDYKKGVGENDWDFSNTQVAVLAIQQAVSCGVEIKPDALAKTLDLYLHKQRPDNGWNYGRRSYDSESSNGSMTAAAVASLIAIRDITDPGAGCPCANGRSTARRDPVADSAIVKGVKWLSDNFSGSANPGKVGGGDVPYWLYAAERAAMATGQKYFGTHNWYTEGAAVILKKQLPDGSWKFEADTALSDTCFCVLFLVKGRGPLLMNKLMYDGAWDRHPYDLARLVEVASQAKEQRINWQAINLAVPVAEMFDAPILFISAEEAIVFSADDKKKLRDYTDAGGTIFFETSCANPAAAAWWKKTCAEIWPEWELKPVDKTHALWSADVDLKGRTPPLFAASDGLRTFLFHSAVDISCQWSTMAVTKNRVLFELPTNMYAYATDRGKLRAKLAGREEGTGVKYAGQTLAKGLKDTLTVARVKHAGDWNVGLNYHAWPILGADLQTKTGVTLKELDPLAPGDAIPAETTLLYVSGLAGCDLGTQGAKWLKDYLAGGGFLFAEAVLGDARFDAQFKTALATTGLKLQPLPADSPLLTGKFAAGATGYAIAKVGFTFSLQTERVGKNVPELLGIYDGEKLVGVYSPFDLMFAQTGCKAFGNRGYAAADARALATNIALYATSPGSPATPATPEAAPATPAATPEAPAPPPPPAKEGT